MSYSRLALIVVGAIVVVLAALGCSSAGQQPKALTVYSGREEQLVAPIIAQFTKATGIPVQVKYGSTSAMAATLLEEGKRSPADVFYAQDPGGLGAVAHLLGELPESITSGVDPRFRSAEGKWVGISGRARVVVYNTKKLGEADLPASVMEFTEPRWKGRMGWAPTNGSFQAFVTALRVMKGEEAARRWLEGMVRNGVKAYANNTAIVQAVASGEVDAGLVNHYYLFRLLEENGESYPARNYYLKSGDPGSVILVSGAGILSTSKNVEAAQKFIEFMLSDVSQQYFASRTYEYPVVQGIKTHRLLLPLAQVQSPNVELASLADLEGTLKLLREVGVVP